MSRWKAGPEKPRVPFCWWCGKRFHGRVFARLHLMGGAEVDVHKGCVTDAREETSAVVIGGSTTVRA